MREYKFYSLDFAGAVICRDIFHFTDDDAAMSHARTLCHEHTIEVSEGLRRVGIVERDPK